jgi:hypothetical protein
MTSRTAAAKGDKASALASVRGVARALSVREVFEAGFIYPSFQPAPEIIA